MNDPETIGERLIHARQVMGLSQLHVAEKAGIAPTQLSRYESGRATPRAETIKRLADALDVSVSWLARGDASMNSHEFDGPPRPGERDIQISLSDEQYAWLKRRAQAAGTTMNETLHELLTGWATKGTDELDDRQLDELAKRVSERLKSKP